MPDPRSGECVLSPVLANLYMHRFIKAFRKYGLEEEYGAVLVNYADDFVVLCRRNACGALAKIRKWFTAIGLEINESKTSVREARSESFDFLGYTFKKMRSYKNGRSYPGATPSVKAVKRIKDNVRFQLHRANVKPIEEVVERLNRTLRGWANYFRYGSVQRVRHKLDRFVCDGMRRFIVRRAKCQTRGMRRYPGTYIFGELGVVSLKQIPRVGM